MSIKLTAVVVLWALNVFSLRAQVSDVRVEVLFPFNSDSVLVNYQKNAGNLQALESVLAAGNSVKSIAVTSFSSPEGDWNYNKALSIRRANSIKAFILKKYPELAARMILNPGVESWDELRAKVSADSRLEDNTRQSILEIIDSQDAPDVKEQKLRALPQYRSLYSNYFKSLRFASIEVRVDSPEVGIDSTAARTDTSCVRIENSTEESKSVANPQISKRTKCSDYTLYYVKSEDVIRPAHMGNAGTIREIRRILSKPENRDRQIVIEGSSSPEGPKDKNRKLGQDRADNLANWLMGQFPDLEGRIVVRSAGENWPALRNEVENCDKLTEEQKQQILMIVDSEDSPERKEANLRLLDSYETLEQACFPQIRYAGFKLCTAEEISTPEVKETVPEETVPEETIPAKKDTTVVDVNPVAVQQDTTILENDTKPVIDNVSKSIPFAALTLNTLYTVGGTVATGFHTVPLAVGCEIPIGKHFSAFADYLVTTPWHAWNNNADCAELMHWDLGARWYPGGSFTRPFTPKAGRRVLDGWYASLSAGMGYYDFERDGKGYQGEEILGSVGLGYNLCLDKHWSINFGLGVGPMFTRYRYYEGRSNNEHLMYKYSGTFSYFGVTDARVTLTYLFYYNRKEK